MARSARDARLENRTNRLKLDKQKRHVKTITEGVALIYRRTKEGYGTWSARIYREGQAYTLRAIGLADDTVEADGDKVFSFSQAQDRARDIATELERLGSNASRPITVAQAAARYLEWFRDHRKGVRETEIAIEAHILPHFAEKPIADLTTREIRAWLERLAAQPPRRRTRMGAKQAFGKAPRTSDEKRARKATANRVLAILKAILNRAFHDELVADDLAWRRVRPFENADEPIVRFLTADEAQRLLNACTPDFRPLVAAALFTGARYGEITALKAGAVHLDLESVYIKPAKSGRGRHVPLSAEGAAFFRTAIAGKTGDELVFTRQNGSPWGRNHHIRPLAAACEAGKVSPAVGFHELRHSYASALAQSGVDLLTISKLLGHADTRITSRHYAHLCDRTLAAAVKKLPSLKVQGDGKLRSLR